MTCIRSRVTGLQQIQDMVNDLELSIKGVQDLVEPTFTNRKQIAEEVEERLQKIVDILNLAITNAP